MMNAGEAWRVVVVGVWGVVGRSDGAWHERPEFSSIECIIRHGEVSSVVVTNHPHWC